MMYLLVIFLGSASTWHGNALGLIKEHPPQRKKKIVTDSHGLLFTNFPTFYIFKKDEKTRKGKKASELQRAFNPPP
jgi:hypothetical protein